MKTVVVVLLAGCLVTGAGIEARLAAQEQRRALAGRPLADVLRELQVSGLKIVFSSELVRPGMRVQKEPASTSDRQILDERTDSACNPARAACCSSCAATPASRRT
jgi:hypothetical protein